MKDTTKGTLTFVGIIVVAIVGIVALFCVADDEDKKPMRTANKICFPFKAEEFFTIGGKNYAVCRNIKGELEVKNEEVVK